MGSFLFHFRSLLLLHQLILIDLVFDAVALRRIIHYTRYTLHTAADYIA